jgi:hypothetical protein
METVETANGPVEIGREGLGRRCCSFMGHRGGADSSLAMGRVLGVGGV